MLNRQLGFARENMFCLWWIKTMKCTYLISPHPSSPFLYFSFTDRQVHIQWWVSKNLPRSLSQVQDSISGINKNSLAWSAQSHLLKHSRSINYEPNSCFYFPEPLESPGEARWREVLAGTERALLEKWNISSCASGSAMDTSSHKKGYLWTWIIKIYINIHTQTHTMHMESS